MQVAKQFLAEYDKQHQVSINVNEVSIKKSDEGKEDKSMKPKQEGSLQSCENEPTQVPTECECIHEEQMSSDGELFPGNNSSSLKVEQDTRNSDAQGFEVEGFKGDEPSTCILPKSNDDSQVSESTISVIPEMQMTPDEVGKDDKSEEVMQIDEVMSICPVHMANKMPVKVEVHNTVSPKKSIPQENEESGPATQSSVAADSDSMNTSNVSETPHACSESIDVVTMDSSKDEADGQSIEVIPDTQLETVPRLTEKTTVKDIGDRSEMETSDKSRENKTVPHTTDGCDINTVQMTTEQETVVHTADGSEIDTVANVKEKKDIDETGDMSKMESLDNPTEKQIDEDTSDRSVTSSTPETSSKTVDVENITEDKEQTSAKDSEQVTFAEALKVVQGEDLSSPEYISGPRDSQLDASLTPDVDSPKMQPIVNLTGISDIVTDLSSDTVQSTPDNSEDIKILNGK